MGKSTKFAFIGILIFLSGCAGTNFVKIDSNRLVLGKTTYQEIKSKMGTPFLEGGFSKNDQQIQQFSYAYGEASGGTFAGGITPARSQGFLFHKGVLIGHEYNSSWPEDSTNFDESKVSIIQEGQTSVSEVKAMLGKPSAEYIYPYVSSKDKRAIGYLYAQTKGSAFSPQTYHEHLIISYGQNLIVTDVEFNYQGTM